MPIVKRRLDICGREKTWEYVVESGGERYHVSARQMGANEPTYICSCGICVEGDTPPELFFLTDFNPPCTHIAEAQRDLNIARQAAMQMVA